jgi:hypothetical protein
MAESHYSEGGQNLRCVDVELVAYGGGSQAVDIVTEITTSKLDKNNFPQFYTFCHVDQTDW